MSPADKILQKALIASGNLKPGDKGKLVDTEGWSKVQAGLRDRAFFSSQVTQTKILYAMRKNVSDLVSGGKSPSEVRRDLRAYLDSIGYDAGENRGTIKDLMMKSRLDVMMKTNADQAKGYASHLRATTAGAILAFPAYELVRVERRKMQRDWDTRWANAAKAVGFEGVCQDVSKKVALKTSPIWAKLSRFGNPFPPFDFNSGMGVRDVKKSVCREIGLLGPNEQPTVPPPPDFNGHLAERVPFDKSSGEYAKLKEKFGDQIQFNEEKREVQWRSDLFADAFDNNHKFNIKLGCLPKSHPFKELANSIGNNPLTLTKESWLDAKRPDGTDHRTHFFHEPDHPENIPLKKGDVDMLPSVWRNPDQWRKLQKDLYELRVEAIDGGDFVLQVQVNNGIPSPWSYFRTTKKIAPNVPMNPRKASLP